MFQIIKNMGINSGIRKFLKRLFHQKLLGHTDHLRSI